MKVTACICVRNQSSQLRRLIKNISYSVNEIVVVDGESSDNTWNVASDYTPNVYSRKPQGYVEPDRAYCVSKANNDWVLVCDADEEFSPEFLNKLDQLTNDECVDAYYIARHNYYTDSKYYHYFLYPDYQLRLYRKSKTIINTAIHSTPKVNGNIVYLKDPYYIIHHDAVYSNIEKYKNYARIHAGESKPKYNKLLYLAYSPIVTGKQFIKNLSSGCYRDGFPGLRAGFNQALYAGLVNYYKAVQA